jgi:CheY-like chemotaxis protein
LVEDYALGRVVNARALGSAFQVSAFGCGEEALGHAPPGAFDVVLADFRMPAMTGIELLELLRARDWRMRRVLMSGGNVPGLTTYLALGLVHAFLAKPFDLASALAALQPGDP